jgi:hypothetical protein
MSGATAGGKFPQAQLQVSSIQEELSDFRLA